MGGKKREGKTRGKKKKEKTRKIEKKKKNSLSTIQTPSPHLDLPGLKLPRRRPVERRHVHAPRDEHVPARPRDRLERPLDAVEDGAQRARPELDRQRRARPEHDVADGQPRRVLVALDRRRVALEADDLADEAARADSDELVHGGAGHGVGDDDGAGDAADVAGGREYFVFCVGRRRRGRERERRVEVEVFSGEGREDQRVFFLFFFALLTLSLSCLFSSSNRHIPMRGEALESSSRGREPKRRARESRAMEKERGSFSCFFGPR